MKHLYQVAVRVLYAVLWPLFGIYLHNSHRARVLVKNGNKILLVKSTYGSRRWELPGGGVEKGETARQAARRELEEETSLMVAEKKLEHVASERISNNKLGWPKMNVDFFRVDSADEAKISRAFEVVELQWFDVNELPDKVNSCVSVALAHTS
ncbi:NUDIX domain-containing protein [Candidatus Saccharibacteria bacterium]|nr:NUDIX domain-containing protein [Candidatus Saccharibacteria bacterium]